jgi:hypothetical protein
MSYTVELNGKDVLVSHPSSPEPKVLPGWTWHAELVRQLIAERDELQQLLADGASLNIALINERDQLRARLAEYELAPTVATVCIVPSTQRIYVGADLEQYDLPPVGTKLIARPEAK